ncbi:MAG: glycosyl hydrolase family 28-related protein, partial [Lentisphaerota bacterium]
MRKLILLSLCLAVFPLGRAFAAGKTIPDLAWEKRSDWIDVKTDVTPAAKGDGINDDTEAIQAAFSQLKTGMTLYFPPGRYRITKTLFIGFPDPKKRLNGMSIIGHGRSTELFWDGEEKGRMLVSYGLAYSKYVGLTFNGRGKAAVGIEPEAYGYETELTYRHIAFHDFSEAGIRIGIDHPGKTESAETLYDNCLFERCGIGLSLNRQNDYDHTLDGCEFRQCGTGFYNLKGNFYMRNCHFEGSTERDIFTQSEHGSSIRRCTSTGSKMFLQHSDPVSGATIQDCWIDGWTNLDSPILVNSATPVILMDCVIGLPANYVEGQKLPPAVKTGGWRQQRIIQSNNKVAGGGAFVVYKPNGTEATDPNGGRLYDIPAGSRGGVIQSASQSFLKSEVKIPGKVFDAKRDFGAAGDGVKDDTEAIRKTIEAARAHGKGAIAYLPTGRYIVKETLEITGSNYYVGGSGFLTFLVWKGKADGTCVRVISPENVTMENISVGQHDGGAVECEADIVQTGSGKSSFMTYDHVWVYGGYQKKPYKQGLRFVGLGKDDVVLVKQGYGNFRFIDSSDATILVNVSYEGSIVVEGKSKERGGFIGFQSRLATSGNPSIIVKDSNSFVISDLYVESSLGYLQLEGEPGNPPGRVTVQGAKTQFTREKTDAVMFDIDNYTGE